MYNQATTLFLSFYDEPKPTFAKLAGMIRANKRLSEHRSPWALTPVVNVANSRQVMRRKDIEHDKAEDSQRRDSALASKKRLLRINRKLRVNAVLERAREAGKFVPNTVHA